MKSTGKRQITIKEDDWETLRRNAYAAGVMPALHIEFGTRKRRLVLIEEDDFDERFPPSEASD
jgi:hypothetical protein